MPKLNAAAVTSKACAVIQGIADGATFSAALASSGLTPSQFFKSLRRNDYLAGFYKEACEINRQHLLQRALDVFRKSLAVVDDAKDKKGDAVPQKITSEHLRAATALLNSDGDFARRGGNDGEPAESENSSLAEDTAAFLRDAAQNKENLTDAVQL